MSKLNLTVYEYDRLFVGKAFPNGETLSKDDFYHLRGFILKQESGDGVSLSFKGLESEEGSACMKLSADRQGREILTVQNYVGTILLPSDTTIEILPKIFREEENNDATARKLVLEMLKACGVLTYKNFKNAALAIEKKLPIFEIYIRIFLDQVFELYKRGLKSGYEEKQENEKFLKGKLLFSQHVKHNFAHAERFYVEYDEFSVNRPENRLIKTTLELLKRISKDEGNKKDLRRLTMIFEDVEKSAHIDSDFQKCTGGRNMQEYKNVLSFCKMFLRGLSFSTYAGKHDTLALLFPMEKLFEGYVAKKIGQNLPDGWKIFTQYGKKYLFEEPDTIFKLKPDICLERAGSKELVLLDTKWKTLNPSLANYGISQADMYQMYAYHKRYNNVQKVILLYPDAGKKLGVSGWSTDNGEVNILLKFVPLDASKENAWYKENIKFFTENNERNTP